MLNVDLIEDDLVIGKEEDLDRHSMHNASNSSLKPYLKEKKAARKLRVQTANHNSRDGRLSLVAN